MRILAALFGVLLLGLTVAAQAADPRSLNYSDRVLLQQALIRGGWLDGKADGAVGPKTLQALFQQQAAAGNSFEGELSDSGLVSLIGDRVGGQSFETLQNFDLPENDYRSGMDDPELARIDLVDCQKLCSADDQCMAYTYNVPARVCFLKTSGAYPSPFEGAVSGRRLSSGASEVATAAVPAASHSKLPLPAVTAADFEGPIPDVCAPLPGDFIAARSPIRPWHAQVLAFLESDGNSNDKARVARANELLRPFLAAVDAERRKASRGDVGILLYDLARLIGAAQVPWQELSAESYMQEAATFLDGRSDDLQALELAIEVAAKRVSAYEEGKVPLLMAMLTRHRQLVGNVPRQWSIFSKIGGEFSVSNMPAGIFADQADGLAERIEWARALGDRQLLLEATGTWLEKTALALTEGLQPKAGQLTPLLPVARAILDAVIVRGEADLAILLPAFDNRTWDIDCRRVSTTTMNGVMRVIMAEGTAAERRRILETGALHTLDMGMFGTDPWGVALYANPMLQLRLLSPDLYSKVASYAAIGLVCEPNEPPDACTDWAFAGIYETLNRGTIALDFARSANQRIASTPDAEGLRTASALKLATFEWEFGSVARAEDLVLGSDGSAKIDLTKLDYRDAQALADIKFDLLAASRNDTGVEDLILNTMEVWRQADLQKDPNSGIPAAPDVVHMVREYVFGRACYSCSDKLEATVEHWLTTRAGSGDSTSFLLCRLGLGKFLDEEGLERLAGEYLAAIDLPREYGVDLTTRQTLTEIRRLRGREMTATQLASIVALAHMHPHPEPTTNGWVIDFSRFMFEGEINAKRAIYDDMLANYSSVALDFGLERDYMAGLGLMGEYARVAGYPLASHVFDEHIVRMFDEKMSYLDDLAGVLSAARTEDSDLLVPVYVRLAGTQIDAENTPEARRLLGLAHGMAMEALQSNWRTGDRRAEMRFSRLARSLRAAAELSARLAADDAAMAEDAFSALQIAMLSDTALSASSAQRRRALVDPDAERALTDRDLAQDDLLVLSYYRSEIGIRDPEWESAETARRTAALADKERALAGYFPDTSALSLTPLAIGDVQRLLHPNEMLLVLHPGAQNLYGASVTAEGGRNWVSPLDRDALMQTIGEIRAAVTITPGEPLRVDFPFAKANALLTTLLGPAASDVGSHQRLLIVVDGPLQQIPLSILPMSVPSSPPQTADDFRTLGIDWLGTAKALVYLPTVGSLRDREIAPNTAATRPFAGIGNPSLRAPAGDTSPNTGVVYDQSGLADIRLLNQLTPLPDTQVEVYSLAQIQGAGPTDVLVADAATETNVKAMPLSDYRVLLFATHGLVAGELGGIQEPGLVLTPPRAASVEDDGYLGLSEVMNLRLNADLVILSACNTAASDGRGNAAGLSGLARGFLTAGSKAVAVTHWSIPSAATLSLNVEWFASKAADNSGDWADALRVAMSEMVEVEGPPSFAHPANWGAFAIFGAP